MGKEHDPGYGKVTDETRTFEEERDEKAVAEAGRGPTPSEEDAAEQADPVSDDTREAYREMVERGAHQEGEGGI